MANADGDVTLAPGIGDVPPSRPERGCRTMNTVIAF